MRYKLERALVYTLMFVVLSSAVTSCFTTTVNKSPGRIEPGETEVKEYPQLEKFPLRLDENMESLVQSLAGRENAPAVLAYFKTDKTCPPAQLMFDLASQADDDYDVSTTMKMSPFGGMTMISKYQGTSRAKLSVPDWTEVSSGTFSIFKCEGEAFVLNVSATKGVPTADTTQGMGKFMKVSFQNAFVDLVGKLDSRRAELDELQKEYVKWRDSKAEDR